MFSAKRASFSPPTKFTSSASIYPSQHPKQVLQVGLQRRYSEYYQAVKQMIDKGMLGDVKFMYAQWHRNPGWMMKPGNWRLFRKTSGGLAAELGSHHFDVADWMFGSHPGDGDGTRRSRHDVRRPRHLRQHPGHLQISEGTEADLERQQHHIAPAAFGGARAEQGEMICGTGGTVHITIGDGKMDPNPPLAIWFKEPSPPPKVTPGGKPEKFQAGASFNLASGGKALPILLGGDQMTGDESFLEKEMKFAREVALLEGHHGAE